MDDLQKALGLFKEQLGEFDNIKLLLGGGEDMTREVVESELLALAQQLTAGEIKATDFVDETKLLNAEIAL